MSKQISLRIVTLVILFYSIFSIHTDAETINSYGSQPSIREVSTYIKRLESSENWQQWIENYLDYFMIEIDEDENSEDQLEEQEPTKEDEQSDTLDQESEPEENTQPIEPKPKKTETNNPKPTKQEPKSKPENKPEQKPQKKPEQAKTPVESKPTETKEPEVHPEKEVSKPIDRRAFERKVAELTNKERAAHGLDPLTFDNGLSEVARVKSNDMFDNNYFAHTSPKYGSPFDMMTNYGISYFSAAENIAAGYPTPEDVVNGWMNSPGHRDNILGESFTHIGVGLADNSYHWTQMFIGK